MGFHAIFYALESNYAGIIHVLEKCFFCSDAMRAIFLRYRCKNRKSEPRKIRIDYAGRCPWALVKLMRHEFLKGMKIRRIEEAR